MLRRATVLATSVLAAVATSSCSLGAGGGQQSPQPAPPPAGNVDPALKVKSPKNIDGADACRMLTPEQRSALQIDGPPAPKKNEYGASGCEFVGDLTTVFVDVNTGHGGLSQIYSNKESFDNFAPAEVNGYPAAQINYSDALCTISTGVADTQAVEIYFAKNSAQSPEMNDPCGYAKKISGEVLKNLPAA